MCEECLEDAMAFHGFALSAHGDLDETMRMVEETATEAGHLIALAVMGTYMCALVVVRSMPPGGRILVAQAKIKDPKLLEFEPQSRCFRSALQIALDTPEAPGDACVPMIEGFVNSHSRREGIKLASTVIMNYYAMALQDMIRVQREASAALQSAISDLLSRMPDTLEE